MMGTDGGGGEGARTGSEVAKDGVSRHRRVAESRLLDKRSKTNRGGGNQQIKKDKNKITV